MSETPLPLSPDHFAAIDPDRPAVIAASTGAVTTYAEMVSASVRIARLFDRLGLRRDDHVAILLENTPRYFEIVWAAQRAGLYFTPVNWHLTADEAGYIVDDCEAKVLFASRAVAAVAEAISPSGSHLQHRFSVDGAFGDFDDLDIALEGITDEPRSGETEGIYMFYSSGTTGQPKGILRPLDHPPYGAGTGLEIVMREIFDFKGDIITYLCPAPLYHAAPIGWTIGTHRLGGTVVLMEHFDANWCLELIERYRVTHAQFVPTHFVRMLKLSDEERAAHDLSSLRIAVHAAAPCPVDVKRSMIEWWGPVLMEYYAGSEANGSCIIDSQTWLEHPGSVGQARQGILHILDENGDECPAGEVGTVWFEGTAPFEYHNDPVKTASAVNTRGWSTLGDLGHVDADGFLYLSDRRSHLIISGGVNIYPQEIENLLTMHPKVADVAVIGVPHPEMGEEVKAVVQPVDMALAGPELEAELIAYCRAHLAHFKCPRSVDFDPELPRLPTGKLFKRRLFDRYR